MITTTQYSISQTPVKIAALGQVPRRISIHPTTTGDTYISGSNTVSSSTGFLVDKAAGVYTLQIDADDELWCVIGSGTKTITVIEITL